MLHPQSPVLSRLHWVATEISLSQTEAALAACLLCIYSHWSSPIIFCDSLSHFTYPLDVLLTEHSALITLFFKSHPFLPPSLLSFSSNVLEIEFHRIPQVVLKLLILPPLPPKRLVLKRDTIMPSFWKLTYSHCLPLLFEYEFCKNRSRTHLPWFFFNIMFRNID